MARLLTPIRESRALVTPAAALDYLRRGNPALPQADAWEIVRAYYDWGAAFRVAADVALAQSALETNLYRFGGRVHANQHNPAGLAATNDGKIGSAFAHWDAGVRAHFVHLLAWCGDARGKDDPRASLVQAAAKSKGYAVNWIDLAGRWAVPGDGYTAGIMRHLAGMGGETMVTKPPIIIDHTPNKLGGYTVGTRRQLMICSHITGGKNSLGWLRDPHPDAQGRETSPSCNYLIDPFGVIHEIVDPHGPAAWANGIDYGTYPQGMRPNLANPIIAELTRLHINPNQWVISIEHEGESGAAMTPAQWRATTALQAWLCQEFGITPDPTHIIGHFEIDGITRANCPGWTGDQWDTLQANIRSLLAGASGGGAPRPSTPSDPGFPGIVQPDRTLRIGAELVPDGVADRVEKLAMQVYNEQNKTHYWVVWDAHRWGPWQAGYMPAP